MNERLRCAVVPLYVLLCLVLGGSAQGIWSNAVLQLLAVVLIGWSLLLKARGPLTRAARGLLVLLGGIVLLVLAQLIPLPPAVWSALPGREFVAEGYALLGQKAPWLPWSLTPYETMATALTLLPSAAVLIAMLVARAYRPGWLAAAILSGTFAAVLIGALQVGSADPVNSPWYFYERTNHGFATGFFANSNHMASLLVISIAVLFALLGDLRDRAKNQKAQSAILLLATAGLLVLSVGIVLNGSLAVLLIGPPVLAISALMLLPARAKLRSAIAGFALLGAAAMLVVYLTPLHDRLALGSTTSVEERQTMWSTTAIAVGDHLPLGSGIASFTAIYPRYEDPLAITRMVTNHAHNDYLEIALETGVPGLLLLAALLLWWGRRLQSIWRTKVPDRYAQAATISIAALLLHSVVDYPLRTAALSSIMAACLVLMARPRAGGGSETADLWPAPRHVAV